MNRVKIIYKGFFVLFIAIVLLTIINPSKASALKYLSNELPLSNNGAWSGNGSHSSQDPYMYVGRGASDAEYMTADIYIKAEKPAIKHRVTIQDACDNSLIDVRGDRSNTKFYFRNVQSVELVSGDATVTSVEPGRVRVECNSGNNIELNIKVNENELVRKYDFADAGEIGFQVVVFDVVANNTNPSGLDYENQFKLSASDLTKVKIGYASKDIWGSEMCSEKNTTGCLGIYNRTANVDDCNKSKLECYWSTNVSFAPGCTETDFDEAISFFDNDTHSGGYQDQVPISYTLTAYPRGGGPAISPAIASGNLGGGNNEYWPTYGTGNIKFDKNLIYELSLNNIYVRNSIQVGIPYEQLFAQVICDDEYEHEATLSCTTNAPRDIVVVGTTISCKPGMKNNSKTTNGPQTFVEFYEYKQKGKYTEGKDPPPTGGDSKLTPYYDYYETDVDMKSGDPKQPHYVWVRESTPKMGSTSWSVQYQPTTFKIKPGTPPLTKLCFAVKVTPDPYDPTDTVVSPVYCYVLGSEPDCIPGDPECDETIPSDSCQSMPNPPNVTETLPDTSPDTPDPGAESDSPSQTYNEYNPQGKTRVTATDDISSGGDKVGSAPKRLPVVSESYQSATISYQPFIDAYPYDQNQANITYDSYYDDQLWRSSSSPTRYSCDPGDSGGGSSPICTKVTIHPHPNPPICRSRRRGPPSCTPSPSTPHPHRSTYGAKPHYAWSRSGAPIEKRNSNTVDADVMEPCYDRTYDAKPHSGAAQLNSDSEDPNNSTYSADIEVNYGVETPRHYGRNPLRRPSQVSMDYTISYYIDRGVGPDTTPKDKNGNMMIIASSSNYNANKRQSIPLETINVHAAGSLTYTSGEELKAGDRVCWRISTSNVNEPASKTKGRMNLAGAVQDGSGRNQDPFPGWTCTTHVTDLPYFRAYGGDVIAGSLFKTDGNCNPNTSAGIKAHNKGGTHFGGAGSQLAAFATGAIEGFVSAAGRTTSPIPLSGLTFANSSGSYGGSWGSKYLSCPSDFIPTTRPPNTAVSSAMVVNGSVSGTYGADSNLTVSGATISSGRKIDIFVTGDVAINSNIVFDNGSWASPSFIPSFRIIASGNIYVAPNVSQLDGLYVAGGSFYSCSNGGFGAPTQAQVNGTASPNCQNNLSIFGSVVATNLYLFRSKGSLRASTNSEIWTSTNTAERFIFSPEIWLASPYSRPQYQEPYEAYTAAPPIL